jgi:hypothetical protein
VTVGKKESVDKETFYIYTSIVVAPRGIKVRRFC